MSRESRNKMLALLQAEVLASSDEQDRANLLYDVVRVVYDTTTIGFSDGGRPDTLERIGIWTVTDAALEHQDQMFVAARAVGRAHAYADGRTHP